MSRLAMGVIMNRTVVVVLVAIAVGVIMMAALASVVLGRRLRCVGGGVIVVFVLGHGDLTLRQPETPKGYRCRLTAYTPVG
jgi:hypothetical protein